MLLKAAGLVKRYERRGEWLLVVDSVDLLVQAGDFICITGQSGSGKSTLLNILAGLLRADSGEILFQGADLCKMSDGDFARMRNSVIGYIPQGNSLLQNFSVLENVCLPWYLTRKDDIKNTARELLAKVRLSCLENESPRRLSGGEARRAAIARGLITNPSIIFADEPTSDLDHENAVEVIRLFEEVNKQGAAVVITTHDPQIPPYAKRRMVMRAGRLLSL